VCLQDIFSLVLGTRRAFGLGSDVPAHLVLVPVCKCPCVVVGKTELYS
jgi:hypothetical protein